MSQGMGEVKGFFGTPKECRNSYRSCSELRKRLAELQNGEAPRRKLIDGRGILERMASVRILDHRSVRHDEGYFALGREG
jgi:hypothetical protein